MNGQCGPCSKWPCGEPPYRPNEWNSTVSSHNCYAYMLNDLMKKEFGSYGEINNKWTSEDAKGFIKVISNQNKIYHYVNNK